MYVILEYIRLLPAPPSCPFPDPQAVCPRDGPVDGGGTGGGAAAADGRLSGPAESVLGDVLVGISVL